MTSPSWVAGASARVTSSSRTRSVAFRQGPSPGVRTTPPRTVRMPSAYSSGIQDGVPRLDVDRSAGEVPDLEEVLHEARRLTVDLDLPLDLGSPVDHRPGGH